MPNVEKDFEGWALNRGLNVKKSSGKPGAHYLAETTRLIQEGYLASAAPRDALIAQLVEALAYAQVELNADRNQFDPRIDAALSAARDRGYE